MKTSKSGADAPASVPRSADKAGARRRAEEEHGESRYVSLEPLAADHTAGGVDTRLFGGVPGALSTAEEAKEKAGECAPAARRRSRCALAQTGENEEQQKAQVDEKLRGGGDDWSGGSASDDYEEEEEEEEDVALLLSANFIPCARDDESHYITTHEILLSELSDHECDFDRGSSAAWDVDDGSPAAPFVDYAPLDSEGATRARGPRAEGTAVSTLRENDPSASAKSSLSKPRQLCSGAGVGQIQLSIRTTSRAINGPGRFLEEGNIICRATRSGDASRCALGGAERQGEALRDRAQRFAAAPGRVHFGRKLRQTQIEQSSGTSSAVSEPDDADKEVRTLTAKTFRSLAHPYFDAANFGASSESSASERGVGINGCSTSVDVKYGDMSQELDQTIAARQNSTNTGNKGAIQAPGGNICALNAAARNPAPPTTAELKGTVSQGQSGGITLAETPNLRCNVKSGEKRTTRAQSAPGSRSAEDAPDALSGGARRAASPPPGKPKEDASKKAIFASSLIKNVISKKMQFEQERKMERGEISEQRQASAPHAAQQGSEGRAMRSRSSRASESSSDCTLTNAEDSGDAADAGSGPCEAATDTTKGTADASNRTLLRSQNSAFRRWKDDEFQKDHERDPSPERAPRSEAGGLASRGGTPTKMSQLFVPSIQLLPCERDAGQQLQAGGRDDGEKARPRSDSTLRVADSRGAIKSISPEIKINLRSVRNSPTQPVAVSQLPAASRSQDLRCPTLTAALRGESADKVPHFTVRDIRDNKAKLHTPIHQVRDVRKLVKSSYHFVSLDSDSRLPDAKRQSAIKQPNSVSPIVIKCQSVNTNSGGNQSQSGAGEPSRAPEVVPKRQEKTPEPADRRSESQTASRAVLEKLQAAVRTMEQLYVFEKNEWKRKTHARQLADSHVPSLLARQEHGAPEEPAEDTHLKGCATGGRTQAPSPATAAQARSAAKGSGPRSAEPPKAKAWSEGARTKESEKPAQESDHENYLAIPVKPQVAGCGAEQRLSQPATPRPLQSSLRCHAASAGGLAEALLPDPSPHTPLAAVYQPQLFCFPPAITPASAPALEPFQALQRKILLDPSTGSCYLLDGPAQPPAKRLFDPETGQYVDIAVPPPATAPVPMALSPYGPAYVIYPGFAPVPSVISAQALGESASTPPYVDAPFYIAAGRCAPPPAAAQPPAAPSIPLQPIISISSRQGPRIIAPPSFDGTTVSFVVEHR